VTPSAETERETEMWLIRCCCSAKKRKAAPFLIRYLTRKERFPFCDQQRPPPTSSALSNVVGMWDVGWMGGTKRSPFPPACQSVPPPLRPSRASGAERKSMHAMRCDGYPALRTPSIPYQPFFYFIPNLFTRTGKCSTDRQRI